MPKTKLSNMQKKMTSIQRDEMIVRCAFARHGIFRQSDMAKAVGTGESTLSKAFNHGFSAGLIFRIHAFVEFTPEEREELLWQKL